jgi:phytanoyl-CoA hydroxylase
MLTADQRATWERDGYLAVRGFFTAEQVDRVNAVVDGLFRDPPDWLMVDNLATGRRTKLADVPAADRSHRHFKLNDLYLELPEVRAMALDARVRAVLAELLGEPAVLCNSLTFEKGSQQPEHIDSLYMTPRTPDKLAATWIALEDAHPDAGQLFYYPGSQTIPLYTFSDGTHHAFDSEMPKWHAYIRERVAAAGLKRETFPAKKGDLFIWSANLVHGGSPIADPARTRKSLVCHYYTHPDSVALGYDCVPEGGDGYWVRRPHVLPPDAIPFRQRVGKWLRKVGLYRVVKRLTG